MITITLANGDWRAIERAVREAGLRILADAGVSQEDPKHEWPRAARNLARIRNTIAEARITDLPSVSHMTEARERRARATRD